MACPICTSDAQTQTLDLRAGLVRVDCPRCGRFKITDLFVGARPDLTLEKVAAISGWLRENPNTELRREDWPRLQTLRPLSVGEKAEKLLLLLARRFPTAGQDITLDAGEPEAVSRSWAVSREEVSYLFHNYLSDHKQFLVRPAHGGQAWKISPAGWDYIHSLGSVNRESQIGFCAMWFDDRLEPLWVNAMSPAITDAGFEPKRIDQHPHNNRIDDEIISMIRRSRFVVADLTGNRAGVYFEAGFAFGLQLPVIWTCREQGLRRVHFDNRQYNFVLWHGDNLGKLRTDLRFRIEATIGKGPL